MKADLTKALEKLAAESKKVEEERKKSLLVLEQERARGEALRQEAERQRALAEQNAKTAQAAAAVEAKARAQLTKELADERDRAAAAAVAQKVLVERAVQLEKRVVDLEQALKRLPPKSAEKIEGKISSIGQDQVTVGIGSDAGLTKGQVLEVYRLEPKPRYLGQVTIVSITEKAAVAKPLGTLKEAIKVGDQVTTKLESK